MAGGGGGRLSVAQENDVQSSLPSRRKWRESCPFKKEGMTQGFRANLQRSRFARNLANTLLELLQIGAHAQSVPTNLRSWNLPRASRTVR